MKRDLLMLVIGAALATIVNWGLFEAEFVDEKLNKNKDLITVSEKIEQPAHVIISKPDLHKVQPLEQEKSAQIDERKISSKLLEQMTMVNDGESQSIAHVPQKDLPQEVFKKLPQQAFDEELVDPVKKDKRERNILTLFEQEKLFELNVGLQSVECKTTRCRLEIYPIDGNSQFFSIMDVMGQFVQQDWFGNQTVNFGEPDEDGIRILHIGPSLLDSVGS